MSKATMQARLRQARKARGLSSSGLDAAAELTRGHTRQIETGLKPKIELETATKLARALGVSLDWLVDGIGDGPTQRPSSRPAA